MISRIKDPSLKTLLVQQALQNLGYYKGACDNWWGAKSEEAYQKFLSTYLIGTNRWAWVAKIDGNDIVIEDASLTWFGGDHDPLDNGLTASGVKTKGNPDLMGVALAVVNDSPATNGSPLAFEVKGKNQPGIPWFTPVVLTKGEITETAELIDNGPAASAKDACDATVALFKALGGNLKDGVITGVHIRIVGAAIYARGNIRS
jgi:peptidoglycan hydrolase-like protein with peptidoglycan-binding domain